DNANASLGGSCRDVAGNQGAASAALRYDATPPTIGLLAVKAGKRSAELHWRVSPDTRSVELARSPGRKGAAETLAYAGPGAAAPSPAPTGMGLPRTPPGAASRPLPLVRLARLRAALRGPLRPAAGRQLIRREALEPSAPHPAPAVYSPASRRNRADRVRSIA